MLNLTIGQCTTTLYLTMTCPIIVERYYQLCQGSWCHQHPDKEPHIPGFSQVYSELNVWSRSIPQPNMYHTLHIFIRFWKYTNQGDVQVHVSCMPSWCLRLRHFAPLPIFYKNPFVSISSRQILLLSTTFYFLKIIKHI